MAQLLHTITNALAYCGRITSAVDLLPIAVTFLAVTIPVFIFAVTLLGSAVARAQQEEERRKEEQRKDLDLKIQDLQNKINALKESGDSSQLEAQLKQFNDAKKKFSKELVDIRRKYSRLEFNQCVTIPGSLFLVSAMLAQTSKLITVSEVSFIVWLLAAITLGWGLYRLSLSLILVQEISLSSQELQHKKMTEAFKAALHAFEQERQAQLKITIVSPVFPHKCKPDSEIRIQTRTGLTKGRVAHNVEIWFYVPDGFGLVNPPENKAWRQASDFVVPNIRTVKFELNSIRFGPYTPNVLVLKAPSIAGKYTLMYRADADEVTLGRENLGEILVEV